MVPPHVLDNTTAQAPRSVYLVQPMHAVVQHRYCLMGIESHQINLEWEEGDPSTRPWKN